MSIKLPDHFIEKFHEAFKLDADEILSKAFGNSLTAPKGGFHTGGIVAESTPGIVADYAPRITLKDWSKALAVKESYIAAEAEAFAKASEDMTVTSDGEDPSCLYDHLPYATSLTEEDAVSLGKTRPVFTTPLPTSTFKLHVDDRLATRKQFEQVTASLKEMTEAFQIASESVRSLSKTAARSDMRMEAIRGGLSRVMNDNMEPTEMYDLLHDLLNIASAPEPYDDKDETDEKPEDRNSETPGFGEF